MPKIYEPHIIKKERINDKIKKKKRSYIRC